MGWNITSGDHVGKWVAEQTTGSYHNNSEAIGLVRDDKIVAGVIYESYLFSTIVCHIGIIGRLNKAYLAAIFDYPFRVCNVEKIIVPVTEENEKSIKLVKNMGFTEEARIKRSNGDMIFFTLMKDNCKFLGGKYG
jgi:RimJ/RimL family protein N-acetyltransferase